MIDSDIRLFTWLDVEEVLSRRQAEGKWPEGLLRAQAYWNSLRLDVASNAEDAVRTWLAQVFEPRCRQTPEGMSLVLESLDEEPRILPVYLDEAEEHSPPTHPFRATLRRPNALWRPPQEATDPLPALSEDLPPLVAFHSFKGGVGRTLHALAFATALAAEGSSVLLVDGDLEAPGITWLLDRRLPELGVSFSDFIALLHGDADPNGAASVRLVASRLQDLLVDGIFVLPAFRSNASFTSLDIRPEHLLAPPGDPFVLTHRLVELGKALDVDTVIVDLRAGLSELSAGLLLDPRVHRVLVTTPSGQSVKGTERTLEIIRQRAPSAREEDPIPAVVFSFVLDDHQDTLDQQRLALSDEIAAIVQRAGDGDLDDVPPIVTTDFDERLVALPTDWDRVIELLRSSRIAEGLRPLQDWLPARKREPEPQVQTLADKRRALYEMAERSVYAERAELSEFMPIEALRRLAQDHRGRLPVAAVVGAKGSGKTYTFLQLVQRRRWSSFSSDAGDAGEGKPELDAAILPLLQSKSLSEPASEIVAESRHQAALAAPLPLETIQDHLRGGLREDLHEGQWRDRWLDLIAWSLGIEVEQEGAGKALADRLREQNRKVLVVVDGLEDLFHDFDHNAAQQTSLRALLQELPAILAQQPGRPLGLLVFARRDIVQAAIRQNAGQYLDRYRPYALRWEHEDVLRLIVWLCARAQVVEHLTPAELAEQDYKSLVHRLVPLWGQKLGSNRSREARTAQWVLAALSDFHGQIQARDAVRLLHLAAEQSLGDEHWQDRVLPPGAVRGALAGCSATKVGEISDENEVLKRLFTRLKALPSEQRVVPFTREQVALSPEELQVLDQHGVILRDGDHYQMPEIFRYGLDFERREGRGRARVLTMAWQASRRTS